MTPNYLIRDDGCRVHPECLSCPLPACIYDMPLSVQRKWTRKSNRKDTKAQRKKGP